MRFCSTRSSQINQEKQVLLGARGPCHLWRRITGKRLEEIQILASSWFRKNFNRAIPNFLLDCVIGFSSCAAAGAVLASGGPPRSGRSQGCCVQAELAPGPVLPPIPPAAGDRERPWRRRGRRLADGSSPPPNAPAAPHARLFAAPGAGVRALLAPLPPSPDREPAGQCRGARASIQCRDRW